MKNFTRILAVCFAFLMCFSFAGCGKKTDYVIYSDNSFAPFEFYDEKEQKYVGVDMEILAAIAEDQAFTYEMKNEGFEPAMGAVQSGQADAMIAGMTINDKRKETFDFSEGYFSDGTIMVVAKDSGIQSVEELAGKKVVCKASTTSTDYAESIKDEIGFEIIYVEGSPEMYQTVQSGNADACFEDYSVIAWAIKQGSVELKTVGKLVNEGHYGFAVKKGTNAELIEKFNAGLKNIKESGKYAEILAKYGYEA